MKGLAAAAQDEILQQQASHSTCTLAPRISSRILQPSFTVTPQKRQQRDPGVVRSRKFCRGCMEVEELAELRAQLQASQDNEARLRSLLAQVEAKETAEERVRDDLARAEKQLALVRGQLAQLQERNKAREEEMTSEMAESESNVALLQKENAALRQQLAEAKQSVQQLAQFNNQKQAGSPSSSFDAVSKEQLRQELLQAALAADKMEQRVRALQDTNENLERTVQGLWRQNQELVDEMQTMRSSDAGEGVANANASVNTSLADELSMFDEPEPVTPVKQGGSSSNLNNSLFSDMTVVASPIPVVSNANNNNASASGASDTTTPSPKLFSDMQLKERDDKQYRDYVYMSLSAIKIALAIKEIASSEMLLKLSAKKVYEKALERRVPLHQVHDFVRKYTVAYVEHMSAPREQPKPAQMSFLGRVLTTYFPSTDYLFRAAEVVPNRGSELGSFLWKKGTLLSRSWKNRWYSNCAHFVCFFLLL